MKAEVLNMGNTAKSRNNLVQNHSRPAEAYTGSFPSSVETIIKDLLKRLPGPVLHLYSGSSLIGDERIDLAHPAATRNITVEEFITTDRRHWTWAILDPPYAIKEPQKLRAYADARPLSGNALLVDRLSLYFRAHVDNILWLDRCAPAARGFYRKQLWLLLPGNHWETVRVLSWLSRSGPEMNRGRLKNSG